MFTDASLMVEKALSFAINRIYYAVFMQLLRWFIQKLYPNLILE